MNKVLIAVIIVAVIALAFVLLACAYAVYGDEIFDLFRYAVC